MRSVEISLDEDAFRSLVWSLGHAWVNSWWIDQRLGGRLTLLTISRSRDLRALLRGVSGPKRRQALKWLRACVQEAHAALGKRK